MTPEQKQQAKQLIADWTNVSKTSTPAVWFLNGDCMAGFLQEIIDAPEPEPVARVTGYYAGYLSIATVDGRVLPAGTALYTSTPAPSVPAPKSCGWIRAIDEAMVTHHLGVADIADDYEAAKNKLNTLLCLNQDIGEYFSAKAPTPSVPDVDWLSNVIRSVDGSHQLGAGALAEKICEAMLAATPTPAEAPADVVRDAARYRWLRTHGLQRAWVSLGTDFEGDNFASFRCEFNLPEPPNLPYEDDEGLQWADKDFDAAIDAAIEREILGGDEK